jgi:hypothetical protein
MVFGKVAFANSIYLNNASSTLLAAPI